MRSSPGKRTTPTRRALPVTDMAQAQLEALKALQATNAGAGKGKVWRRIKEPRGAEQGVLDVLQGPFTL